MLTLLALAVALSLLPSKIAAAAVQRRGTPTQLSATQISAYTPYTYFASGAYCNPSNTLAWNCGGMRESLSVAPFLIAHSELQLFTGFRADSVGRRRYRYAILWVYWLMDRDFKRIRIGYVGYYPTLKSVIVAFQGTNTSSFTAVLEDGEFFLESLDSTAFPRRAVRR